jgi:hypothetical protein
MSQLIERYWFLLIGLGVGVVVIWVALALHKRGSPSSLGHRISRVILLWPLLLDADQRRGEQRPGRLLVLIAIMVAIAVIAIIFTPSRMG